MKNNYNISIKLLLFTFLCSVLSWGQSIFNNPLTFTSAVQASPYTAGQTVDPNITVSGIIRGSGITGSAAANRYSASGWSVGAIDLNDYFEFTLTPNATYEIDFVSFVYTSQVSSGTPSHVFRSSLDGYTSNIGTPSTTGTTISLAAGAYQNLTTPITFRFYSFGLAAAGTTFSINDFTFNGVVSSTSSNTITTNTAIVGSPFCVTASTGASVSVPFTSSGTYTSNTYTAQLSNAAGTFASPVNIGTLVSDLNSGIISAIIPAGTAAGVGYRIRVISNSPSVTGTDNTVNLVVQNAAAISTQPSTAVQNICQSVAATALSVTATGTTLTYQWYSNVVNANSGGTSVGTNSASYTPSTASAGTLYYYCVVTAACGVSTTSNVSGAVNVTAVPSTPAGTISISANPSCGAATLMYSAPSANLYWQTTAGGTSTANNTLTNYTSSATAGSYTVYVRELNGSCWSAAISITFTVVAPIVITVPPPNRIITDGSNTTFTITTTGSSPTYQWQVDTGGGFINLTNVAPYSTVTTSVLNITAAPITMNGYLYRCVVTGASPCGSVTSASGSLTVNLTAPNNPTAIVPCYGNTNLGLSWTASSGGSAPDGYMVFALAGATTPAATSVAAGNANLYTANSDFSLAGVVTASLGKCIYKGTGTSVVVTGLTNLSNYSFKVVAYRGTTGTGWSSGINTNGTWNTPTTNVVVDMPEVTSLAASIASGQSGLSWTRPTPLSCYDEYIVVANQGSVVFTPAGDGTAYTTNTVYSGSNQVVYKGTGNGVTVNGLTNGLSYCYKVFVRRGTEWSDGVQVCQTPNITYCVSNGNISFQTSVTNVTLNTLNNSSAKPSGYSDYTAISTNLQQGEPYTLSASINTDGNYTVLGFAWIDFNQDGDFTDTGEAFDLGAALNVTNGLTSSSPVAINVPINATLGVTRMRVIATYNGDSSPCLTGFDGEVEDYTINITAACVPSHSVTSFGPTSGPTGTDITINGSGFTAGTTVTFNGINTTVVFVSTTQIIATVPVGSTTGTIKVKEAGCNYYVTPIFTQLKQSGICSSGNNLNDLIISEVFDSLANNSWYMELYNPTGSPINLDAAGADYKLVRYGDIGLTTGLRSINISGIIPPGGVYLADIGSDSFCGALGFEYVNKGNGINENDEIRLTKNDVTVDMVNCPNEKGYTIRRNVLASGPSATYNAADWTLLTTETCADLDIVPFSASSTLPTVNTNPGDVLSCNTTASFAVTATAFGAGVLTYQWYYNNGVAAGWSVLNTGSFAGVTVTGNTSATLNLNGAIDSISGYQFYCAVIQDGSCTILSDAAQLKVQSTTWNGTTWSNGFPNLATLAVIDNTYITATNGNFSCCSLLVNSTSILTISSNGYVEVQNNITNNGTLTVLNTGSLVQISDSGVNSGNIQYQRTANIRKLDYVYWASPVAGFSSTAISSGTNLGYQYKWLPTTGGTNNFGNWTSANETMVLGKGYIVRGPDSYTSTSANYTATFNGVPNNGIIAIPISRGTWNGGTYTTGVSSTLGTNEDDNWNLVGNPYPSAIHAINFLTLNTNINGFVNIWTHGTLPSNAIADPFYSDYAYNYTPTDYITYNASGASSGPGVFNGRIAAGQGFFVSMLHTSAATTENLIFNNSLRNSTHNNGQFFRNTNSITNTDDLERHRIWLDLVTPSGISTRSMIGYIENATNGKDRLFDAFSNDKLSFNIFSLIEEENMLIQGRKLPFNNADKVNIGVTIPQDGMFKIAISSLDGLFLNSNQNIYLEDKLLNVIYDLRAAPYTFMGNKGTVKDRFVIRYTNGAVLANETFYTNNHVVLVTNDALSVVSAKEKITGIVVFDLLGRKLFENKNISTTNFVLPISQRNAPLFIEVGLQNGTKMKMKTVF